MKQIDKYVAIKDEVLSIKMDSLRNAQSISPDLAMEPRMLLGDSFKVKVKGVDVPLTHFAAMYPGGATEANKQVVATLESLSIASNTVGSNTSNTVTFAVTAKSYEEISSAYKQAHSQKGYLTIEVVFAPDSFITGQFHFRAPVSNEKGKWGDILTLQTEVTFLSTDEPEIELIGGGNSSSNAVGLITLYNIRASNNFDVSLTTKNSSDDAKVVTSILANNSE